MSEICRMPRRVKETRLARNADSSRFAASLLRVDQVADYLAGLPSLQLSVRVPDAEVNASRFFSRGSTRSSDTLIAALHRRAELSEISSKD